MLLEMQESILYGPVDSRRLGKSLGINLSPYKNKLCSFKCIYCHYGWTKRHTLDSTPYINDLPKADDVVAAVEQAMKSPLEFAYVTFSGSGEPTIHPDFPEMVEKIVRLRDKYRPEAKVALLSNSSGLLRDAVQQVIHLLDLPVFKLDAGTEDVFNVINRPAEGISFETLIEKLISLKDIYIQTLMIDGEPCNVSEEELTAWFGHLKRIGPVEVHIYSIDRPVPGENIKLVSPQKLEEIAERGREETGVTIRAFYLGKNN
jgi:wyosine [tRNA(Phe)-imidazoG37] synthetase (radical SAM superfamily)